LTLLGFLSWLIWHQSSMLSAADQRAVQRVTLTAFGATDILVVIPHASPDLSVKLADTDIAAAREHAREVFQSIYDAGCTPCQGIARAVDTAIARQADGVYRALDGGVRHAKWLQISASQTGAVTVTLEAKAWSKVVYGTGSATPTEELVMVYTLHKVGTSWLIGNLVQQSGGA
jgi:hypothetical protein